MPRGPEYVRQNARDTTKEPNSPKQLLVSGGGGGRILHDDTTTDDIIKRLMSIN